METYHYPKSQALFERASKVIPAGIYGHLGPSEGCYIPVSAYPFYASRAEGPYIWDLDGNCFTDYMCAYGPIVLGYNHPEVDAAARAQMELGNCTVLPSERMVELAELLVDTVDSADWAFFAKNGGDVTNLGILTARAATGRKKIVKFKGGYHGVAQWMQDLGYAGIIAEDVANVITIPFNDAAAFERVIAENPDQIAGLISTPYHHPAMADNALPEEGFWKRIRELCTRHGIVLIIDDVRCGFRLDTRGSDHHYGFKADLICFCKALGNGYNISALCGNAALKSAASAVFYTGSYWLSSVPMAAAIKTVTILRQINGAKIMTESGKKLTEGLVKAATEHGFHLKVSGEPAMWFMRLTDDEGGFLHQEWIAECVRRGAFFTSHHNLFMNTAMDDGVIKHTLDIAEDAFKTVLKNHPERK
ncbi:MAG: aminotransferase class III-fold pyridoxal phosphate-dependent enzyme [Anaerolineaceae bacterium]|nr:aminotransferase class III-fold pyridoxal phosphate-dependent enzyme [Anaerolineaceae bacterium]